MKYWMMCLLALYVVACTDYAGKIEDKYEIALQKCDEEASNLKSSKSSALSKTMAENQKGFDIVVRDFEVYHPDFENFQEEAYNSLTNKRTGSFPDSWLPSYVSNAEWVSRRSDYMTFGCGSTQTPMYGIAIGANGYPHDIMTAYGATSTMPDYVKNVYDPSGYAWYGEFSDCAYDPKLNPLGLHSMRGLVNDLCTDAFNTWSTNMDDSRKTCNKICKNHQWSQIVYVTPGMVEQTLLFSVNSVTGALDLRNPLITRARYACDNVYFEQWFSDVEGVNKRSNSVLYLTQDPSAPNFYEFDKNWNNGGFFPLDSVDASFNWMSQNPNMPNQFGPQSLSIFCPPYDYQWAATQTDFLGFSTAELCNSWKLYGGPKDGNAAVTAAMSSPIGLYHLRNFGFTVMGYAAFKYQKGAGEIFEFVGDDDMWVFVDGVLAMDLGGTHLAATGKVDMDYLASKGHGCYKNNPLLDSCSTKLDIDGTWRDQSWHYIHFFYADRQSDGSNLRIRSSLSQLATLEDASPSTEPSAQTPDPTGNQSTTDPNNTGNQSKTEPLNKTEEEKINDCLQRYQ